MSNPLIWVLAVCFVSGVAGLAAHDLHLRHTRRLLVWRRMTQQLSLDEKVSLRARGPQSQVWLAYLNRRLLAAGVHPLWWHAIAGGAGLSTSIVLGLHARGLVGALLAGTAAVGAFYAITGWFIARRRSLLLEQLPPFLEHLLRAVDSGSSVQQGLQIAAAESPEPLSGVFARVNRNISRGADIASALEHLDVFRLRELSMVSLTIRVNQRFGGPIRDLLRNIVTNVQQRDRSRREFRALTGETRISAWVLGALPVGIALYISGVNPSYLETMLADPAGRLLLYAAGGLQLLGCLVLWRMVKSV